MKANKVTLVIITAALCLLAGFFLFPRKPLSPLRPSPLLITSTPGAETTQTTNSSFPNPAAPSSPLPSGDKQTSAALAGPSGGEGLPDSKGEPLWGVEIAPLRHGEFHYSFIVDGKWEQKDRLNKREPDFTNRPAFEFPPTPDMGVPRQTSPNSAQFFYVGKLKRFAMFSAPIRGEMWGIDEFRPLNSAAEANWKEILANPNLGKISGVVSDANHRPIPKARVMAQIERRYERTVECNAAGQFSIDRLPFGPMNLKAKAWGYQISEPVNGRIEPDGKSKPIEIILQPGVAVLGQVTNDSGQPVQWAMINIQNIRDNRTSAESAVSDEAGRYALTCLAPGAYRATCGVKGYGSVTKELQIPKDASTVKLDFIIAAGGQITGKVVQPVGEGDQPVPSVMMYASTANRGERTDSIYYDQSIRTKKDGTFTFEGVPYDMPTNVGPLYSGPNPKSPKCVTLEKGKILPPLEFRLPPPGDVKGHVVNMDKQPVVGAEIIIHGGSYYTEGNGEKKNICDADGAFHVEGLFSDVQYTFSAKAKGYAPANSDLAWPNSKEEIIIVMHPGNTIKGQVVIGQGRQPLPGMTLTLDGTDRKEIETDAEGRFVWEDLPKGDYQINGKKVSAERTYLIKPQDALVIDESQNVFEVTLEAVIGQCIRGKALMQDSKAPVANARVACEPLQDQKRFIFGGHPSATSNEDGAFEIGPIVPGKYRVLASKLGLLAVQRKQKETDSGTVVVEEGKDASEVELLFTAGGMITGVVVDTDGAPISNASVWAASQGTYDWHETVLTNESGKFAIPGLPLTGNKYRAKANNSKGQQASSEEVVISAEKPTADVRIVFTDGALVSGTVKDAAGKPIANAKITAGDGTNSSAAITGADGKYSIQNLIEGRKYYFRAEAPNFLLKDIENVEIKNGQETIVDFVLEKGMSFKGIVADLRGEKIGGASGQVHIPQSIVSSFITSFEGDFQADNLSPSQDISIRFDKTEIREGSTRSWSFVTGKFKPSEENVVFVLKLGGILKGRLVDAAGKPISAKTISTRISNYRASPIPEGTTCELEAFQMNRWPTPLIEGRFEISRLPLGKMALTFESNTTAQKQIPNAEIGADLMTDLGDIPIEDALTVDMRLVDAKTGKPINQKDYPAECFIFTLPETQAEISFNQPGSSGLVTIKGVPHSAKTLYIQSCYLPVYIPLPASAFGKISLGDMRLDPGETLTGTVKGPKGEIAANSSVSIIMEATGSAQSMTRSVPADSNGRFIMRGLLPGAGKLSATCMKSKENPWITGDGPFQIQNLSVTIKQGQPNNLDIVLPAFTLIISSRFPQNPNFRSFQL